MRQLSRLALAVLYGGGAILLVLLLANDNVDALTTKVGYTAIAVIILGLVAAAGARLLYHHEPVAFWGYATLLIAAVTFVLLMVELWRDDLFRNQTRTFAMVVISILLGGGSLVLSGEDGGGYQPIRIARGVAILALVGLGGLAILAATGDEVGARWLGVASVLFVVPTLSLPFLRLADEERVDS